MACVDMGLEADVDRRSRIKVQGCMATDCRQQERDDIQVLIQDCET